MGLISFTAISDGTTGTGTQVNTPLNTIFNEFNGNITNANISAGAAIATTKLADDAGIGGAKLLGTYRLVRQNDTTNATEATAKIFTGWGVITPGASNLATETVTFPSAFASIPIVLITYGGDHASSTTYGAGGLNLKIPITVAGTITTTNFVASIRTADASTWAAGNTVFYQWMAIGI